MQPISCQLPSSPSTLQTIVRDTVCCSCKSITADGRTISTVPASPLVYPGNKPLGSTLSDYRVCQFTKGAIQVVNSLMRSVAGFAIKQIMDSPEIGLVCPGLKKSLVALLALPTLVSGHRQNICPVGKMPCDRVEGCIPKWWICDGIPDCPDKSDEDFCSLITGCGEKGHFLCNNREKCIPHPLICDSRDDCGDGSDESTALCHSATKPLTIPLAPESSTESTSLSLSDRYIPYFGMLAVIFCASAVTYYSIAVYRSVKAMRCTNPEASTCQLVQMALRQPHYYTHPHQPVPIDLPTYQQAMELPTYQEAMELPTYQQATREQLPPYAQTITETWV